MLRLTFTLTGLLSLAALCGQIDYPDLSLPYGPHAVGFRHLELTDSTRTYNRMMDFRGPGYRPVSVSIWEPARRLPSSRSLTVRDYLDVLKKEEEWPDLPFEYFFDWFYVPGTEHNVRQAAYATRAIATYAPLPEALPVIVYAASYRASSTENFLLAEYLASHGFRVVAVPSKGYDNLNFTGGTLKDATAQSGDLDFVIGKLGTSGLPTASTVILSGFSFGGLAHVLTASDHHRVAGVVSLDGTIKYRPEVLEKSPRYDARNFAVPFVHFSQRDIPAEVLAAEDLPAGINDAFTFYDSLSLSDRYQLKSRHLSHRYFATYGLLFQPRDERQDPAYDTIIRAHRELVRSVERAATLLVPGRDTAYAYRAFERDLAAGGEFVVVDRQLAGPRTPQFPDLVALSREGDFARLPAVNDSLRRIHPGFRPAEGDLNTLGLQLIFSEAGYLAGKRIFAFALTLYPASANLYDSLAEGLRYHGDVAGARKNFARSLELNPQNANAVRRLRELDGKAED